MTPDAFLTASTAADTFTPIPPPPASFDARSEPWIPVLRANGRRDELGLRDALLQAHTLRAIQDPMPTVEFGLYRLLTAFALDIYQLEDSVKKLEKLLAAGRFDADRIDAYFERHKDRFDLFDTRHPFLQTGGMEAEDSKPLAALLPPVPSGTNAAHFHHGHEDDFSISASAAARLLTAIAPFMTAGGAGLAPSINGAPPWYVLVSRPGDDLFSTLCLNCCVLPLARATPAPPSWACNQAAEAREYTQASLLQSLTWQPRRIQLVAGGRGRCQLTGRDAVQVVRHMKFTAGAATRFEWRDPAVAYKTDDKSVKPLRPQEGKQVWRDTGPLALLQEKEYKSAKGDVRFERPALVTQFAEMFGRSKTEGDATLCLTLYGMRTDMKMKVFEWQREELNVPQALVWNSVFHEEAQKAMEQAGSVAAYLYQSIKRAYPRDAKGNKGGFDGRIADAQRGFWQELRPHYDTFLDALAGLTLDDAAGLQAARDIWGEQERRAGRDAFEAAVADLDVGRENILRVQVVARKAFYRSLFSLFETPEQKAIKSQRKTAKSLQSSPSRAVSN